MTTQDWLQSTIADAQRRGLANLEPLLQALAGSIDLIRSADWNDDAAEGAPRTAGSKEPGRP